MPERYPRCGIEPFLTGKVLSLSFMSAAELYRWALSRSRHDLPLLTHNLKHFKAAEEHCGLRLIKP